LHPDLEEAVAFHEAILAEGAKALVGYDAPKQLANVVLLSEIPTTYDKKEQRQVSSGNLLLRGVPGVGKTFFGVILAAISNAKFARLQGRADLQPTEVVGFQMINPATGELMTEFGPLAEAEIILLDEINRIPLKSQSAFLEGLQDRTVTVGKTTYELPAFSFAIATMNPVELGQGTFPLSEAATDRFAMIVNIGYLPTAEERKLVNFTNHWASTSRRSSRRRVPTTRRSTGSRTRRPSSWSAASISARPHAQSSAGGVWPRRGRSSFAVATRSIRKTSRTSHPMSWAIVYGLVHTPQVTG
jgi:MoxR-like ATPase